jgi:hypothetical protein
MPYIKQSERQSIDADIQEFIGQIGGKKITNVGELNYIITKLLLSMEPQNYSDYNSLIGVLECVKQEFYRRAVVAFEEKKKEQNGDVY